MSEVGNASCDLVFSGQNLEHLWPDEVSGFLLEAARVLRPGGHLVVDSPNRLLTAPLNWSHPEHTIELTLAEVAKMRGVSPEDAAIDLVIEDGSRVGTIYFLMSEENLRRQQAGGR